ncbi:MAG: hypothetical protein EBQ92_00295, partial [Proteobacteria bacterium]|nr:hypothetical protein [Pseudomonadota bacterium]
GGYRGYINRGSYGGGHSGTLASSGSKQDSISKEKKYAITEFVKSIIGEHIVHLCDTTAAAAHVLDHAQKNLIDPREIIYMLEIISAYWLHELIAHGNILQFYSEIQKKSLSDGYTPVNHVFWPKWNTEKGKVHYFTRNDHDFTKTLIALSKMGFGFIPAEKNTFNEDAFASLESVMSHPTLARPLPRGLYDEAIRILVNPEVASASRVAKLVANKITDENYNSEEKSKVNYQTIICWLFSIYPQIIVQMLIEQCTRNNTSMKDATGYWNPVDQKFVLYSKIIKAGPNQQSSEYVKFGSIFPKDWDGKSMKKLFDILVAKMTHHYMDMNHFPEISFDRVGKQFYFTPSTEATEKKETEFYDPLCALIGLTGSQSDIMN